MCELKKGAIFKNDFANRTRQFLLITIDFYNYIVHIHHTQKKASALILRRRPRRLCEI